MASRNVTPLVEVGVSSNAFYAARLLRGIGDYAREQGGWRIVLRPRGAPREWDTPDGIIVHPGERFADRVRGVRWVVSLLEAPRVDRMPAVTPDERAIGRAGARHLLDRGFRQFAFFSVDTAWAIGREDGFADELARHGHVPVCAAHPDAAGRRPGWAQHNTAAFHAAFLRRLAPPVGVMCFNDTSALGLLAAAKRLGLRVPDDVALLGVDDDEMSCRFGPVPLSSVDPDFERIGREAARVLHAMMQGRKPPPLTRVPPGPLITRQSTDVLAIPDPGVRAAMRVIRERACDGLTIEALLKQVPLSRRMLERKFREHLGHSPGDAIRRTRLEAARAMLAETGLSIYDVAARSGFANRNYLSRAFAQAYGRSPRAYRSAMREG